uniref:40S ribosomal protein S12 n=1 Tax=Lygus hesperus TaxID=30085 RepID=A0A0A9ZFD0_LYGHE
MAEETVAVEVPVAERAVAFADPEPESLEDAISVVIRKSHEANGLVRGLSEVARALDRRTAHMCILADDCDDEEYKKLITALCKQGEIDLINVEEREKLAQWANLVRKDDAGNVKKTMKCSCVAIRDFGERSRALDYLLAHLQ